MPINSRKKGSKGELEFAKFLTKLGYNSKRGQQFKGTPDSPDVETTGLTPPIHWEVKRTERSEIYPFMEQAREDAGEDQIPVVAHRKNNQPWLVIMDAASFLHMLEAVEMAGYKEGLRPFPRGPVEPPRPSRRFRGEESGGGGRKGGGSLARFLRGADLLRRREPRPDEHRGV